MTCQTIIICINSKKQVVLLMNMTLHILVLRLHISTFCNVNVTKVHNTSWYGKGLTEKIFKITFNFTLVCCIISGWSRNIFMSSLLLVLWVWHMKTVYENHGP